jgi:hypothetical protein
MNCSCRILVAHAQHRPMLSARRCRASSLPLTHAGAIIFCGNIAYEDALLVIFVWRDTRRCWKWLRRRADHRSRHQCVTEQPSCAPTFHTMYCCSSLLFGGNRADIGQCRPVEARDAVSTIDLAARARWRRGRVRQGCLRCTSTRYDGMADRAEMSDNVDSSGAWCSVDYRCRHPCTVAPSSYAPRLPTICQYLLWSFGGTSADVGQCRPVLMRGAVSTRDLAAHARWHRRRLRHGCLRCNSARCCCLVERAQILVNADSSRRAVDYRPSTSLPVHDGAAVVCAKVAYDVPVLAVVEWRTARRCRTMSTRRGARCSVDHRPRCQCAVVPPSCAPTLPTMYQYSLS